MARRAKFDLAKARDRAHVLIGLALAVANIDEVIALIRAAPNPATAREQLMARHWPAADVAPLVKLVADPRSVISDDQTLKLTEEQAKALQEEGKGGQVKEVTEEVEESQSASASATPTASASASDAA